MVQLLQLGNTLIYFNNYLFLVLMEICNLPTLFFNGFLEAWMLLVVFGIYVQEDVLCLWKAI